MRKEEAHVLEEPESASPNETSRVPDVNEDAENSSEKPASSEDTAPPLPNEEIPPLPNEEAPPLSNEQPQDDGWEPVLDETNRAYYFYNRFTQATQWDNPRVPEAASSTAGIGSHDRIPTSSTAPPGTSSPVKRSIAGGYNPAIHGDYDPNADYALEAQASDDEQTAPLPDPSAIYAATGSFNRFTGKWQNSSLTPENYNDENKSKRQMSAFFDVDAAANSHDGRSLKAERQGKKLTKEEVKAFREKRRAKKEEKRRAWLMD
jgi:hypothetical protein